MPAPRGATLLATASSATYQTPSQRRATQGIVLFEDCPAQYMWVLVQPIKRFTIRFRQANLKSRECKDDVVGRWPIPFEVDGSNSDTNNIFSQPYQLPVKREIFNINTADFPLYYLLFDNRSPPLTAVQQFVGYYIYSGYL